MHWISLSSVEEYFYQCQKEVCVKNVFKLSSSQSADRALSSMEQSAVSKVRLEMGSRRACDDTNIVLSGAVGVRESVCNGHGNIMSSQ
jgi:hypothetical protein